MYLNNHKKKIFLHFFLFGNSETLWQIIFPLQVLLNKIRAGLRSLCDITLNSKVTFISK